MKRFFAEYFSILGYVMTGLLFALATFLLFVNFYHYKEVNTPYVKSDGYVGAYEKNKDKIETIRNNISVYNTSSYRGGVDSYVLLGVKSGLEICADKYDKTEANKIFAKKTITVADDYKLLGYLQSDIINDCVVLHIYSLSVSDDLNNLASYQVAKPFVDFGTKSLINDADYVKRILQSNSNYRFSSDYSRSSIFEVTRDSYTRLESTYTNSLDLVVAFSEWFKKAVEGGI